jgi:hypothetical protein
VSRNRLRLLLGLAAHPFGGPTALWFDAPIRTGLVALKLAVSQLNPASSDSMRVAADGAPTLGFTRCDRILVRSSIAMMVAATPLGLYLAAGIGCGAAATRCQCSSGRGADAVPPPL